MTQLVAPPSAPSSPAPLSPARAPLVRGWPLVGVAWHMRQAPLPFMLRAFEEHPGDAIFFRLGPYKATLVRSPELIKRIFVDNAANYSKQTRGYQKAKLVLGEGLVTSEGELWQRQRRIATPAFNRQRVAAFATVFTDATTAMLTRWRELTRGDRPIDIFQEMMRLTLRIALQTLLGTTAESELEILSPTVTELLERTNDIITNPLAPPQWVPTPKSRRFARALATLDGFVYRMIARRKAEQAAGQQGTDLLSLLIAARDEQTGEGMSDQLLRDEAVTTLIAGHETTANALTWALHLVSEHPPVREKLEAEVDRVLTGRVPTAADLPALPYTRAVLQETMRLYPPAWMIGRAAREADVLGPYTIGAGEFALVSPYVTHRNPNLWENPSAFDPERFIDGRADALPKFSYLPFGGGQRFCIGSHFAMLEATLILAMIAQAARNQSLPDPPVVPWAMITLRPLHGVRAKIGWRL